jgi:hypothetical protein
MKNKIDPNKAFKKTLKISGAEKGSMRAEKQVVKATIKGQPLKAAFKNKVADIKYTKAMREMSGKSARTDIGAARKVFKAAKKGM